MGAKRLLSELFYPSGIKCVVCGDDLPKTTRYCVCNRCELSYNTKYCLRCGRAMKNMAEYCDHCQNYDFSFDFARAPFVYENEIIGLVRRLKYGSGKYLGEIMAQFMVDVYFESGFNADLITFVPMPPKREKSRGYNQAEVIAEKVSEITGIPVFGTLDRVKYTHNLARMGRREREQVVLGAFSLSEGTVVKDKNILLIDDVFTTGVTSNECSRVLKTFGCGKIFVLTFATSRIIPELY